MDVHIPKHLVADCASVAKAWGILDMPTLEARMGDILREAVRRRSLFVQEVLDRTPKGKLILEAAARMIWLDCKTREALDFGQDQDA